MRYPDKKVNNRVLFNSDAGLFIREAIKDYVLTSPSNSMIDYGNQPFFGELLLAFADVERK